MQGAKRLKSQDGCRKWHQLAFHVRSLIIIWIDFPVLLLPRYTIPSCRFYRANSIMRIPSYRGNSVMQIPLSCEFHCAISPGFIVRILLYGFFRAYSVVQVSSCGFYSANSIVRNPSCAFHCVHFIVLSCTFHRAIDGGSKRRTGGGYRGALYWRLYSQLKSAFTGEHQLGVHVNK